MIESLADFYKRIDRQDIQQMAADFKGKEYVDFRRSMCHVGNVSFSFRDFYKVGLVTTIGKLYFADKWILIDRPAILFSNPMIPYAWEAIREGQKQGCFCIFNEMFIKANDSSSSFTDTPLLDLSKERLYFLDERCQAVIPELLEKIQQELQSDYPRKNDIIRSYLHLITHEVMKMEQANAYVPQKNAAQRIAELFLALLERQFPIDAPQQNLQLKTPADYANRLSVHVNHLNRVVKSATGRTTSQLITNRIVQEAVRLLQLTTLSIAEVAFALGFEEPASFSNFIRKHTEKSPSDYRTK